MTFGVDWSNYFTEDFYQRKVPVWSAYDETDRFGDVVAKPWPSWHLFLLSLILGVTVALVYRMVCRGDGQK